MPGLRGFSATQLKYMRMFYEEWNALDSSSSQEKIAFDKSSVTTDEIVNRKSSVTTDVFLTIDCQIDNTCQSLSTNFSLGDFLAVPFTHHCRILDLCHDQSECIYYIHRCAKDHLTAKSLIRIIKENEFHNYGRMPNNFLARIPDKATARKAVMQFKDSYALDFVNVEQLGERDSDYDERVLEQSIIHNIKNFILEMGSDFAFIGNQKRFEVFGEELFPDLIFFNRELNCLVVIELKTGKFKTNYLGQLVGYLQVADDQMRKPHENPTIGIILCKEANHNYVEYVLQRYDAPMGVATYRTSEELPEELRRTLPPIEDLQKLL